MAKVQTHLDRVGALASSLCAIHCVATGLLFGVLTTMGATILASREVEIGFGLMAVSFGVLAGWQGYRNHKQIAPLFVLATGLVMIGIRFVLHNAQHQHHDHVHAPGTAEWVTSVLAGLCLVGFHIWNSVLGHKKCECTTCAVIESRLPSKEIADHLDSIPEPARPEVPATAQR